MSRAHPSPPLWQYHQPAAGREKSAVLTAELTKAGDAVAALTGGPTIIALHHHDIIAS